MVRIKDKDTGRDMSTDTGMCKDMSRDRVRIQISIRVRVPIQVCLQIRIQIVGQIQEHVGVMRNTQGNLPNLVIRIANHKKILGALLSTGMARGHRGNPAASIKIHQLYCTPVLFSGLASLVLSKPEVKIIDHHYQTTLQNIQRLHPKTPRSIVFFLAGSLPGEALLHLRQLSLFSMICHLPKDPLHSHARYALTVLGASANSWFGQIKELCLQY